MDHWNFNRGGENMITTVSRLFKDGVTPEILCVWLPPVRLEKLGVAP